MKSKGFLILLSFLLMVNASDGKDGFTQRTNIIIVVDVEKPHLTDILKHVWILLDGISLRKYRIALYSTNGVFQKLIDYQSRQCTVNKLRLNCLRFKRLSVVLKTAIQEVIHQFKKDENIFVVLTDRPVDDYAKHLLNLLKLRSRNLENYIIELKEKFARFSLTKTNKQVEFQDLDTLAQVFSQFPFYEETTNSCQPTFKQLLVHDECRQQCECVNGRLVNCARLRSQFSELSLQTRMRYIDAFKTLATDPRYKHTFYKHVKIHPSVDFEMLHSKEQLLPFHRKYTLVFENYMRLLDCRITIPYWNFALNAKHVFEQAPGYHIWDNVGGFGSTHTSVENGFCVETGPFRYPQWQLPEFFTKNINEADRFDSICPETYAKNKKKLAYCKARFSETAQPRCMTRLMKGLFKVPAYERVYRLLHSARTTFKKFERFLRMSCHASIHNDMGGDFGQGYSSILPEFFPLHSMLDAMWNYWQHKGPGKRYKGHWMNDKKFQILHFHTPRYWYLDNNNLELCGVKIKYTNIFPKNITEIQVKEDSDRRLEDEVLKEIEQEENALHDAVEEEESDDEERDFVAWLLSNDL